MIQPIDLRDVAKYYEALPHQIEALKYLQLNIPYNVLIEFSKKWRSNSLSQISKISSVGIDLIKHFEGCELEAYPDPGTNGEPYTIGYGSTRYWEGNIAFRKVKLTDRITQSQAEQFLKWELEAFETGVKSLVKVPISQSQFDALVSFAFNCGVDALRHSTLLKKLNEEKYFEAANEFLKWNKAGSRVLEGLTRRRNAEYNLFLGNNWNV